MTEIVLSRQILPHYMGAQDMAVQLPGEPLYHILKMLSSDSDGTTSYLVGIEEWAGRIHD